MQSVDECGLSMRVRYDIAFPRRVPPCLTLTQLRRFLPETRFRGCELPPSSAQIPQLRSGRILNIAHPETGPNRWKLPQGQAFGKHVAQDSSEMGSTSPKSELVDLPVKSLRILAWAEVGGHGAPTGGWIQGSGLGGLHRSYHTS